MPSLDVVPVRETPLVVSDREQSSVPGPRVGTLVAVCKGELPDGEVLTRPMFSRAERVLIGLTGVSASPSSLSPEVTCTPLADDSQTEALFISDPKASVSSWGAFGPLPAGGLPDLHRAEVPCLFEPTWSAKQTFSSVSGFWKVVELQEDCDFRRLLGHAYDQRSAPPPALPSWTTSRSKTLRVVAGT